MPRRLSGPSCSVTPSRSASSSGSWTEPTGRGSASSRAPSPPSSASARPRCGRRCATSRRCVSSSRSRTAARASRGDQPGARPDLPGRAALEEVAGREAAPRITEEELAPAGRGAGRHAARGDTGDLHALMVHDTRFHEIIVEASGNQVLIDVWRSLRVEARSLVSALKSHSDLHSIAELHRPVLQAVAVPRPRAAGPGDARPHRVLRRVGDRPPRK